MARVAVLAAVLLLPAASAASAPSEPGTGAGASVQTVYVGAVILDVDRIDSSTQTFSCNLFVALRWQDPGLAEAGRPLRRLSLEEIAAPPLVITNQRGELRRSLPEVAEVDAEGWVIRRQMYVGTFSQALDLRDFPFDRHELGIYFAFPGYTPEQLDLVPDPRWEQAIPGSFSIQDSVSVPDWRIESHHATPRPYVVAPGVAAPGYALRFSAARRSGYYLWNMILPLVLIAMMSWSVFWIDPAMAGTQIGVATSSILTLVAYRFTVGLHLPPIPYMTRMDNLVLAATLLVFLALLQVILTSALAKGGKETLALAVDRVSRMAFPALFVLALWYSLIR